MSFDEELKKSKYSVRQDNVIYEALEYFYNAGRAEQREADARAFFEFLGPTAIAKALREQEIE